MLKRAYIRRVHLVINR